MNDGETSVKAEWDAEVDRRAQEVIEGEVELISGEDFHRDIQAFMAELGIQSHESAPVQAEWDAEINRRAQEVMEGNVELISAEESERRIDVLFAKHGRQRKRLQ